MPDCYFKAAALTVFVLSLAILATCDHKHNRLPDRITLPLVWVGLILNIGSNFASLEDSVLGAVGGYLTVRLMHDIRFSLSSNPGIGLGDAKLLAALGAWLGWQFLAPLLISSALLTFAVYSHRSEAMPFGVGLSASGAAVAGWNLLHCGW